MKSIIRDVRKITLDDVMREAWKTWGDKNRTNAYPEPTKETMVIEDITPGAPNDPDTKIFFPKSKIEDDHRKIMWVNCRRFEETFDGKKRCFSLA